MSTGFSAGLDPVPNTSDARSSNWVFHCVIWFGCTSNWLASSARVLSPRTAARATFALKAAEWLRRGRLAFLAPVSRGTMMPHSGSDSTYTTVQISGATSTHPRNIRNWLLGLDYEYRSMKLVFGNERNERGDLML